MHFAHRAYLNDILNFVWLVCVELEVDHEHHERIDLRPRPTRPEHFEKIPLIEANLGISYGNLAHYFF